jgi:hypothetical protein
MERLATTEQTPAAVELLGAEGRKLGCPSRFTDADPRRCTVLRREELSIRDITVARNAPRSFVAYVLRNRPPAKAQSL